MRRVLAMVATTALVLAGGCGGKSYELRLAKTLEDMAYQKRLDDNLQPAVTKTQLEPNLIFLRPPKGLTPAKVFQLTELEPGKFDVSESYYETDKQNLHVLARIKRPKNPAAKKPAAEPATNRGEFNADVIAILNGVFNVELDPTKAKEEGHRNNKFKHLTFEANGKVVQVYLYGTKATPYEVALIYEYPKAAQTNLSKIDLSLGSFATAERARRAFAGGNAEEEAEPGAAGTGGGAAVF